VRIKVWVAVVQAFNGKAVDKAALVARLLADRRLTDKTKAAVAQLERAGSPLSAADAAGEADARPLWSGEFDLVSYDALAGSLEDARLTPLSGRARLSEGHLELELDVQHRSGDNVGLMLRGTVATVATVASSTSGASGASGASGGAAGVAGAAGRAGAVGVPELRAELSEGEVFVRDVGDIGEMMETEARLRAALPPSVRATLALSYLDDELLIARCTAHEETPPPKHWKHSRFPTWMGRAEDAVFVLARRGAADDAWRPARVESKKRGSPEELEVLSDTIRQLDRDSLGGYETGGQLGGA
jgi:hypothetical protein